MKKVTNVYYEGNIVTIDAMHKFIKHKSYVVVRCELSSSASLVSSSHRSPMLIISENI